MKLKTLQRSIIFVLCLLLLGSCATTNTPPQKQNKTQPAGNCNPTGETHTASNLSAGPVVQGSWTMFHGNISRDGSAPVGGGNKLTLAWSYCTGGAVFSSPVVQNGIVYIASTNTTLTALDIHTAKVLWQIQADDAFFGTPALQNGMLYVASLGGTIYAVDSKYGFVHWQTHLDTPGARVWSSPGVANGLVILGTASTLSENPKEPGQVLAFDAATGKQRWRTYVELGGKPGGGVWSSPAIDVANKIVYVGTGDPDDGVQALDLHTGHLVWHWRSVTQDVADTDVGAGPMLYSDSEGKLRVSVGGKDGDIYSLDAKTGHVLWRTHVGDHVYSSPAFAHGTLYAVGVIRQKAVCWALDAQTGMSRWQYAIPTIVYASPAIVGQTLYLPIGSGFGSGDGGVEVINATNGQRVQYADLHSTVSSSPAVLSSWLFVGARDGNLYAFVR